MDDILAQAHSACMRAHGDPELGRHEQDAQDLAHARKSARIDLAHVDRLRLQELLEHHPVMRVLARRDADPVWLQCFADGRMPEDVVRCRRLFDEPVQCPGERSPHIHGNSVLTRA